MLLEWASRRSRVCSDPPPGHGWDNLIQLRPALAGTQLAGWQPTAPVAEGLGCRLLADQRVPVAPRVGLSADVYVPRVAGRYPVVVPFGAYSTELQAAGVPTGSNETGGPALFTGRGYVRVVVTRRGMGRSDGEPDGLLGGQDVDDLEEVIAWAAVQPWSNGAVALFGTSYYPPVQSQVAVRRPPALKAMFQNEMCTDYLRHIMSFGGTPAAYFATLWTGANFTERMVGLRVPPLARAAASRLLNSRLKPLWERAVTRRMSVIMDGFMSKTPTRDVAEQWANWMFDGRTRAQNSIAPGPPGRSGPSITRPGLRGSSPSPTAPPASCWSSASSSGTTAARTTPGRPKQSGCRESGTPLPAQRSCPSATPRPARPRPVTCSSPSRTKIRR